MTERPLTLVLASASPRRSELLGRLGLDVTVAVSHVDETPLAGEAPATYALRLALEKARAAARRHPGSPLLAADTVVALGDRIFGKPRDRAEAAAMLAELAGRTHAVVTAMAVLWREREATHVELARVTMVAPSAELRAWYLATGEGDDKAGAYAVQGKGALLIERVEGNVQAVVGLPLAPLPALLARVGLRLAAAGACLTLTSGQVTADSAPA